MERKKHIHYKKPRCSQGRYKTVGRKKLNNSVTKSKMTNSLSKLNQMVCE